MLQLVCVCDVKFGYTQLDTLVFFKNFVIMPLVANCYGANFVFIPIIINLIISRIGFLLACNISLVKSSSTHSVAQCYVVSFAAVSRDVTQRSVTQLGSVA